MGFDPPQSQRIKAGSFSGAKQELETGPFVLRSLLDHVPLSEDGDNDDIKINCVDYLGKSSLQSSHSINILIIGSQRAIFILVPQPQSSSTLSRSRPILPISLPRPPSSSPRDCVRALPRAQSLETRRQVSSRSSCCPRFRKHACCATIPSPSILCLS